MNIRAALSNEVAPIFSSLCGAPPVCRADLHSSSICRLGRTPWALATPLVMQMGRRYPLLPVRSSTAWMRHAALWALLRKHVKIT